MRKGLIITAAVGLVSILLWAGCKTTRGGYESPKYRVVIKDGVFETRDYPPLIVAETPMPAEGQGMNDGFNKLFRFITGGNSQTRKIAMTTPVLVNATGTNSSMAFVMPAKYDMEGLPKPADPSVSFRRLEAGRYAVMRFSGWRSEKNQEQNSTRLLAWASARGLEVLSAPEFAYYDPPWIPGFLRRNEVRVRVKA